MTDPARPRVVVAVVALGESDRLRACLESLVAHRCREPFDILCVINPAERDDPAPGPLPAGVTVVRPGLNLGWAGGLHLVRSLLPAGTDYLVWAQDDMTVADGWLDALIGAADAHPAAGAVGSVEVDPVSRLPNGVAGGFARPAGEVRYWNATDVIRDGTYTEGRPLDWITSKGMLTRVAAWDDVRGTDPRLFPLNHIDKDYSLHLRTHGWSVIVAPDAQLLHAKHQSAPMLFRQFLMEWQEPAFDRRWGPIAARLTDGAAKPIEHECAAWDSLDDVERLVGREASRMLVPTARFAAARAAEDADRFAELAAEAERHRRTVSWRVTAPLRAVRRALRRR